MGAFDALRRRACGHGPLRQPERRRGQGAARPGDRLENERFVALRSHFGFESWYCRPGIKGSHEKGGVEGEVGRFRRNHLVPVPQVDSLGELNELMAAGDAADDGRRIAWRDVTVGEGFAAEAGLLRPLPEAPYGVATVLHARGGHQGPGRGAPVRPTRCRPAWPGAGSRCAWAPSPRGASVAGRVVARHERALHRGDESLVLDHYLEVLVHKPGALAGSVPLAQARARAPSRRPTRASGTWPGAGWATRPAPGRWPGAAVAPQPGGRLGAGRHRRRPWPSARADPEVVAVEARRHAGPQQPRRRWSPIGARPARRPTPRPGRLRRAAWRWPR